MLLLWRREKKVLLSVVVFAVSKDCSTGGRESFPLLSHSPSQSHHFRLAAVPGDDYDKWPPVELTTRVSLHAAAQLSKREK